jgi:ATP-binding protein involved in chromosome partitioning
MEMNVDKVKEIVMQWADEKTHLTLGELKAVKEVAVKESGVVVRVQFPYPIKEENNLIQQRLAQEIKEKTGIIAQVEVSFVVESHVVQRGLKHVAGVKNIIAVASGKGGVGKSTVAVNLALSLALAGAKVGMLDADIYGPSLPLMLGVTGRPTTEDGKMMKPLEGYGIQVASIGFLVNAEDAMVWRGPMVTQALQQLLEQTQWDNLDYLIVDMPPGTGDIQLTLAQRVPVTGAVIVTTPQDIALLDARRGLKMFEKVGIPILGIVENMSVHVCSACGHVEHLFGQGGGQAMCAQYGVEFLGELPLNIRIREQMDQGKPIVVAETESEITQRYQNIALKVAVAVAKQAKDMQHKFPTIVVQHD